MNEKKMTIMFCTCDRYKDLWEPFFHIFYNHWIDCDYEILINTESESYTFPGLNIHSLSLYNKTQNVSYGQRMLDHLKYINTPYVMILLDDFFLRKNVDSNKIKNLINYLDIHPNVKSIRLTPYYEKEAYSRCTPLTDLPGYYSVPLCAGYKLNFQVCIWRTSELIKYWRVDDDPWRWEVFANITTFNSNGFLVVGEKEGPVLDYGYTVNGQPLSDIYRGKWVRENNLEELFRENNVNIDFSLRGYYDPSSEKKHFNNIQTVKYVFKRIGIRNTITLSFFLLENKIKKILKMNYYSPNQYPLAFEKKRTKILKND